MDFINLRTLNGYIKGLVHKEVSKLCLKQIEKQGITRHQMQEWVRESTNQRAFNQKQAAAYCGISVSNFAKHVKQGDIASTVQGDRKYYLKENLDKYLDQGITAREVR